MAKMMITCPQTGKYVSVGIEIDAASFKSSEFSNNQVMCPHCSMAHTWSRGDVHLIDEVVPKGSSPS